MSEQAPPEIPEPPPGLDWLSDIPEAGLFFLMAAAAGLKAFVPPLPADTVVLVSAILVGQGSGAVWLAVAVTSVAGAAGAVLVYLIARHFGRRVLELPGMRRIVRRRLLARVERYHGRLGSTALFTTRFVPGLRHVVPVFAGLVRLPPRTVIPPLVLATVIWYATIVAFGGQAGHQLAVGLAADEFPWPAVILVLLGLLVLFGATLISRRILRGRRGWRVHG